MNQFSLFAPAPPSIEGMDARKAFASYSADTIGDRGIIRKPVPCNGDYWINVGSHGGRSGKREGEMYRLETLLDYPDTPTTYAEKLSIVRDGDRYPGDYARSDPNGFYHGMTVKSGSQWFVLCGPPLLLVADETDWMSVNAADESDDCETLDLFVDDDDDGEQFDEEDEAFDNRSVYDDEADGGRTRIGNTRDREEEEEEEEEEGFSCVHCGVVLGSPSPALCLGCLEVHQARASAGVVADAAFWDSLDKSDGEVAA